MEEDNRFFPEKFKMNRTSTAFAPANISCIFGICPDENPRWAGSLGVGFTLNEGVVSTALESLKNEVIFNGEKITFPTVSAALAKLTGKKISIRLVSKLPLGCGFGLSGASALASSYAVNELLKLKKTKKELAIISHISEVENKTGLGDVVNQFYGGFLLKLKPSSYFAVKRLPIDGVDVYCRHFSAIETGSVISNHKLKESINKSAAIGLKKIKTLLNRKEGEKTPIKLGSIIKISREFALNSLLLKDCRVMDTIESIEKKNGNASMIMLGNAVFSDINFKGADRFIISEKGAFCF